MAKGKVEQGAQTFTVACSGCGALVQVPVTIDPMTHYRCPECFRARVSRPSEAGKGKR
jgi:predicted RNA-binding Zn-ribbon protein involved in translation (DUF1610 family)